MTSTAIRPIQPRTETEMTNSSFLSDSRQPLGMPQVEGQGGEPSGRKSSSASANGRPGGDTLDTLATADRNAGEGVARAGAGNGAVALGMSARSLSVHFGKTEAVRQVDLSIEPRNVTAIIGPSGCGKTTFLRALNRMHDHTPGARVSGSVLLGDTDIYARDLNPVELRTRVGMVFQRPNPFPTMSIRENVTFAPKRHGLARGEELEDLVENVLRQAALWDEVKDRLSSSATSLSGGQQQRLCIARALAVRPEVLLMDEPASALDPIATQKIEDLIYELKSDYTIVIVTHNMQQAARVSDFTAFFYMGRLIEMGPTDEVFTTPKEEQTEGYITGRFG
jgi:phosphate transport system ATP-binding protein